MEHASIALSYVQLAVIIAVAITPVVFPLILSTAWGQKHKADLETAQTALTHTQGALDTVIGAVGQVRLESGGLTASTSVTAVMKKAEETAPPAVVATWKKHVAQFEARLKK